MADNVRQLVAQAGREGWRPVDLRGLAATAHPEEVLARLLAALGGHDEEVSLAV